MTYTNVTRVMAASRKAIKPSSKWSQTRRSAFMDNISQWTLMKVRQTGQAVAGRRDLQYTRRGGWETEQCKILVSAVDATGPGVAMRVAWEPGVRDSDDPVGLSFHLSIRVAPL